jgi:alpha-beta hydrolase superfamily lysophospholipase
MERKITLNSRVDSLPISILEVTPDALCQESVPVKAVLQLSHGMCGCKERYLPFMRYMASKGIVCVAGDHRGHGESVRSSDDLGYMYEGGYRAMVDDLRMITSWIVSRYPGLPIFLLGHSMGSMAARLYAKYDDSTISGLILTGSPSWEPFAYLGRAIAGLMCFLGMSHYRMERSQRMTSDKYNSRFAAEGTQAWTCSDPAERESFMANPLCNFAMTANGSYNLLSMMIDTYDSSKWIVSNPSMPVFFISGADDPMLGSELRFHSAAMDIRNRGYTNVTSVIYPYMRHEVLNEKGKEQVWTEVYDFINLALTLQDKDC